MGVVKNISPTVPATSHMVVIDAIERRHEIRSDAANLVPHANVINRIASGITKFLRLATVAASKSWRLTTKPKKYIADPMPIHLDLVSNLANGAAQNGKAARAATVFASVITKGTDPVGCPNHSPARAFCRIARFNQ